MRKRLFTPGVWLLSLLCIGAMLLSSCGFTLRGEDLSPYLSCDTERLDRVSVTVPARYDVTNADVEEAILAFRILYREKKNDGAQVLTSPVGPGDDIGLAYTVYDGEGKIVSDTHAVGKTPLTVTVGTGKMPDGLLDGDFIGLVPAAYALKTTGTVLAGETVYFDGYYTDGEGTVYPEGILRADDDLFGAGFRDTLTGKTLGEWVTFDLPFAGGVRSYHVRPRYASTAEKVIERDGVTVRAHLLFSVDCDLPELTPDFVREKAPAYAGEGDPVAAFTRGVRENLYNGEERVNARRSALEGAILACFTFRELPRDLVAIEKERLSREAARSYELALSAGGVSSSLTVIDGSVLDLSSYDAFVGSFYSDPVTGDTAEGYLSREAERCARRALAYAFAAERFGLDGETLAERCDALLRSLVETGGYADEDAVFEAYGSREYLDTRVRCDYVMGYLEARDRVKFGSQKIRN